MRAKGLVKIRRLPERRGEHLGAEDRINEAGTSLPKKSLFCHQLGGEAGFLI